MLTDLDNWDLAILAAAAFIAVASLVRLMLARREELVKEVRDQVAATKAKRKKKRAKQE